MEHKKELTLLGGSMEKNGYISQVKSMISELAQYRIEPEQMDGILEGLEGQPLTTSKQFQSRKTD